MTTLQQTGDSATRYAEALNAAYEAAANLFGAEELPRSNSIGSHLERFISLTNFYHEQCQLERHDHQAIDRYARDLRAQRAALQAENQALRAEVDTLKSELLNSRQSLGAYEPTDDQLKEEIAQVRFEFSQSNERIKDLEGKVIGRDSSITALESKIAAIDPLVQVGTAIRLRCLEKSRGKLEGCPRSKLSDSNPVIEMGNAAAHHGNGDADSALFHSGILPQGSDDNGKFSQIFAKMYQSDVSSWSSLPQKMRYALNCVATLNGLEAFGYMPNAAARGPIIDHVDVIRAKYDKLTGSEFEADEDVCQRLGYARSLTEDILKAERQSKGFKGRSTRSKFLAFHQLRTAN